MKLTFVFLLSLCPIGVSFPTRRITMSNKVSPLYGWWSDEQSIVGGWSVYTTPSGGTIKVSMVSPGEKHETCWQDMKPLGLVVDFLEHYDNRGKLTSQSSLGRKMY